MTTAAAYRDSTGKVAIAADYAITGNVQFLHKPGKITQLGGILVAVAGVMPPPFRKHTYPGTERGVYSFASDFLKLLQSAGHGGVVDEMVNIVPGEAIVVIPGHGPFWLGHYGNVIIPDCEYVAIGSGSDLALGALHMAKLLDLDIEQAIGFAMSAAGTHDPNTSVPFTMVTVDAPKPKGKRPSRKLAVDAAAEPVPPVEE